MGLQIFLKVLREGKKKAEGKGYDFVFLDSLVMQNLI